MLFIATILISSCKKDDPEPFVYTTANIRIVNAVVGSSPQDFYQADTKVSTTAINYGEYSTSYLTVKAGPSTVSYRTTTGSTTASSAIGVDNDLSYTAFLFSNSTGSAQITGFQDDTSAPPAGKARVRFLNIGAALNNTLSVVVSTTGGATLTSGLAYGYVSAYSNIDPNVDLAVTVLGAPTTGVIPGNNFVAGKVYTVWFDAGTQTSAIYHVVVQK
jgi:hypothetical protein